MVAQHALDRIALAGNARRQSRRAARRRARGGGCSPSAPSRARHRPAALRPVTPAAAVRRTTPPSSSFATWPRQPLALGLALDAAREAHARAQRVIDEIAARHGDVHAEPRALPAPFAVRCAPAPAPARRPAASRRCRRDPRRAGSPSGRCRYRRRPHRDRPSPARAGRGRRRRPRDGRSRRTTCSSTSRPSAVSAIRKACGRTWQIRRSMRLIARAFSSAAVSNSGRPTTLL